MRVLEVNYAPDVVKRYFLLAGETYTIGRKDCRLSLPADDPSISRHHATITVRTLPPHDVSDPKMEANVTVTDCSKHGTLVNKELIGRNNGRFVYSEDTIKFGRRVTAHVRSATLVLVESSDLGESERLLLLSAAMRLGALVVKEPVPSRETFFHMGVECIGFLYITHDGYEMTPGILIAMAHQYNVTTLDYLNFLVGTLREDGGAEAKEFPLPTAARPASPTFHVGDYLPPLVPFYLMNDFLVTKPRPCKVLQDFTFIIADMEVKRRYESLLYLCGAVVTYMSLQDAAAARSHSHEKNTILLVSDKLFTRLTTVLGIDHRSVNMGSMRGANGAGNDNACSSTSTVGVNGFDLDSYDETLELTCTTLYRAGVCVIPERNVQRAIFTGSPLEIHEKSSAPRLYHAVNVAATATTTGAKTTPPPPPMVLDKRADSENHHPAMNSSPEKPRGASSAPQPTAEGPSGGPLKEMRKNNEREPSSVLSVKQLKKTNHASPPTDTKLEDPKLPEPKRATEERSAREKKPVVVQAPFQLNGAKSLTTSPKRQRVTSHKVSMPPPTPRSSSSALGTYRSASHQHPSKTINGAARADSLEHQKEPRHTLEAAHSVIGSGSSRQEYVASQPVSRRCSVGSFQRESTSTKSCSASFSEPVRTRRVRTKASFPLKTRESSECLYREKSFSSSFLRSATSTRRPSPVSRNPSPLTRTNTTGRRFSNATVPVPHSHHAFTKNLHTTTTTTTTTTTNNNNNNNNNNNKQNRSASSKVTSVAQSDANAVGDMAYQQDEMLGNRCAEFMQHFLTAFAADVEKSCWFVLKENNMDAKNKKFLEEGVEQVMEFLRRIQKMECDIPSFYNTDATRESVRDVRQKALITLRRILTTYEAVKLQPLLSFQELRDAVSCRPSSPLRSSFSRQSSMQYKRRSSLFTK